jgi:hypothetical protein
VQKMQVATADCISGDLNNYILILKKFGLRCFNYHNISLEWGEKAIGDPHRFLRRFSLSIRGLSSSRYLDLHTYLDRVQDLTRSVLVTASPICPMAFSAKFAAREVAISINHSKWRS